MSVSLDPETLSVIRDLQAAIEGQEFDLAMTALEVTLARLLLAQVSPGGHPHFLAIGARMIHDHLLALFAPGMLD